MELAGSFLEIQCDTRIVQIMVYDATGRLLCGVRFGMSGFNSHEPNIRYSVTVFYDCFYDTRVYLAPYAWGTPTLNPTWR